MNPTPLNKHQVAHIKRNTTLTQSESIKSPKIGLFWSSVIGLAIGIALTLLLP